MKFLSDKSAPIIIPGAGLLSGIVFGLLFGDLDPYRFVVEELTMGPVEIPFIITAAYVLGRFGWKTGCAFTLLGALGSWVTFAPAISVTPVVFLKNACTGMVIGGTFLRDGRFAARLMVASLPGLIVAVIYGFPLVYGGIPDTILEEIRREAADIYNSFMSPDDAKNAAENAVLMMKEVFGVGFTVFSLNTIFITWVSFVFFAWMERRSGRSGEKIPQFIEFSMPFHAIWIFLVSFGLVLTEYQSVFPIALNICLACAGLYGTQGVAIVVYHMRRASFGRIPRILFWLMFFITIAFSSMFLALVGIIDNWYNLRPSSPVSHTGDTQKGNEHEGDS